MSNKKECCKCARWAKPLKSSACFMGGHNSNIQNDFKKNDAGTLYCLDFKSKSDKEGLNESI